LEIIGGNGKIGKIGTVTNGGPLSKKILEISLEIRSEAP
jgi:hypothetical protein